MFAVGRRIGSMAFWHRLGKMPDPAVCGSWLSWLSYSQSFGLENPVVLDLSVVELTFAIMFRINIASIIGMILAIFIYKKI